MTSRETLARFSSRTVISAAPPVSADDHPTAAHNKTNSSRAHDSVNPIAFYPVSLATVVEPAACLKARRVIQQ